MKQLIFLIMILAAPQMTGQEFFIKKSIDWKMLFDGPGHSYELSSSYNPEVMIGFDLEKGRVGMGFEDHDAINYSKWFIEIDKRVSLGKFDFYAGVETGVIWRSHTFVLSNFDGLIVSDTQASFTAGINAEVQFKIYEGIHLSANINTFTTEGGDTDKKEFLRWDVMGGLVFKIPYGL